MNWADLPNNPQKVVSKAMLSLLRRSGYRPWRLYLPALHQMLHDPREAVSTFHEIFVREIYRPVKSIPVNGRVVDVGSHFGLFAIYAMLNFPVSKIDCYEPNPQSFRILTANIGAARNKHRVSVSLNPAAVALTTGQVVLSVPRDCDTAVSSTILPSHASLEDFIRITVPTMSIAKVIGTRCDYLKIDAEGAEYDLLSDSIISPDNVREIAVEMHNISESSDKFNSTIRNLVDRGYRLYDAGGRPVSKEALCSGPHSGRTAEILHFA